MAKSRRVEAQELLELVNRVSEEVESCLDKYNDRYDNMSESRQESEYGETMEDIIGTLDNALESINEAVSCMEEFVDLVNEL